MSVAPGAAATWLASVLCLWVRRRTWAYSWEVATSANIAGLACWVLLSDPAMSNSWRWLRIITGIPNCEEMLAGMAYLVGITALTHSMIHRLGGIDTAALVRIRIELPATVYLPTMVALYWHVAPKRSVRDIFSYDADAGLACYLLLFSAACLWVLGHLTWALLVIRRDPRSKAVAIVYLGAASLNVAAVLSMSVGALWDDYQDLITWHIGFAATLAYVGAAWYSWQRKKSSMFDQHTPLTG